MKTFLIASICFVLTVILLFIYVGYVDKVAKEEGCPLIDLRSAFLSAPRMEDCFSLDGIHPSTKGQQLIFDTLLGIPESLFAEKAGQSA